MTDHAIRCQCPACSALTRHAIVPVPQVDSTGESIKSPSENLADFAGVGPKQRLVCTQCEKLWEAAIVPVEQLAQLRVAAENLVAARRQIAMMRLILSKDQLERLEDDRRETIKIHRAA